MSVNFSGWIATSEGVIHPENAQNQASANSRLRRSVTSMYSSTIS